MTDTQITQSRIVSFVRKRDYRLIRELGKGACGQTVLLYDDQIKEYFVCKKFEPYSEGERQTLFGNFVREIKLLHQLHHPNIVRVFNYYLYPEQMAGYILMEFVDGFNIEDYCKAHPEHVNELFVQAIRGFGYLEQSRVLHRDIRPGNLLVSQDGQLKIIDLGFGKEINATLDFDKSVTLNWWCQVPEEFRSSHYDFATEVYFVGKLFQRIIAENELDDFEFNDTLRRMCDPDPGNRIQSFLDVEKDVRSGQFSEIVFTEEQLQAYRIFASNILTQVKEIAYGSKYADDADRIGTQLSDAYKTFMLEEFVPDARAVLDCLILGGYDYKSRGLSTEIVWRFVRLLQSSTPEQRRIIVSNLHTRLDTCQRYVDLTEDVPF